MTLMISLNDSPKIRKAPGRAEGKSSPLESLNYLFCTNINAFFMRLCKPARCFLRRLLFFFSLSFFLSCEGQENPALFSIGKGGTIKQIIISDQADPVVRFAANELHDYIEKITEVDIPVLAIGEEEANAASVFLSVSNDTSIHWDGFSISGADDGIHIRGKEPRALLYAVYTLLEEAGCSFVYPGKQEEIVPVVAKLEIPSAYRLFNPLLEHRGLAPYGLDSLAIDEGRNFIDWMAKNKLNYILVSEDRPSDSEGPAHALVWKDVTSQLLPELQKRGFFIEMSEHCTPTFFPRTLFAEHPEWFALNNGKRVLGKPPYSGQICYSNKEAIKYYARSLAQYAAEHPEFHTIGTWPLDGGAYCECEPCKDPQTVFNAVVEIASEIKKVRPDILVEHLAYKKQTWQPPLLDPIPENISVLWCRDPGESEPLLEEWVKKISPKAGVYQFEYFLGDNYRSKSNVHLRPAYAANVPRYAKAKGFRGVISLVLPIQNWWRSAFNDWFFAQACWAEDFDVEKAMKNYCRLYYGELAGQAEVIFSKITKELQQEPFEPAPDSIASRADNILAKGPEIIRLVDDALQTQPAMPALRNLNRVKAYLEFMILYARAYQSRKISDLQELARYSQNNPDYRMVLIYPEYISDRCGGDFRK